MSKTTEQCLALDKKIAEDVMGWRKWDNIPQAERDEVPEVTGGRWDYLKHGFSSDEYETFRKEGRDAFWWKHGKLGWIHAQEVRDWQPPNDVAQAMEALEALSQKGVNYSITRFTKAEVIVQLWGYVGGVFCVRRWTNKIMCETICLAIEQWMDAEELQDDPG